MLDPSAVVPVCVAMLKDLRRRHLEFLRRQQCSAHICHSVAPVLTLSSLLPVSLSAVVSRTLKKYISLKQTNKKSVIMQHVTHNNLLHEISAIYLAETDKYTDLFQRVHVCVCACGEGGGEGRVCAGGRMRLKKCGVGGKMVLSLALLDCFQRRCCVL